MVVYGRSENTTVSTDHIPTLQKFPWDWDKVAVRLRATAKVLPIAVGTTHRSPHESLRGWRREMV